MENLPVYISILFIVTTAIALLFFYKSADKSRLTLIVSMGWLAIQSILGLSGFYKLSGATPPRLILLIFPPMILILSLFLTAPGKRFVDNLDMKWLTLIHAIRIPVEIILLLLFINKAIPRLMTFEGRNLDILSGLTAGLIYYLGFIKKKLNSKVLLAWNIICLALLINIVVNGILSAPSPLQQFGFDQPNIAIYYFPFVWLPSFIVPLVLLAHLASIRQLLQSGTKQKITWQRVTPPL